MIECNGVQSLKGAECREGRNRWGEELHVSGTTDNTETIPINTEVEFVGTSEDVGFDP
jgi:hypothetical protein